MRPPPGAGDGRPLDKVDQVVELTRSYLSIPSVVGFEDPFARALAARGRKLGREVESRPGAVVWAGQPGAGVLSVHIDRHGLVGSKPGEFEYAAYRLKRLRDREDGAATRRALEKVAPRFAGERVFAYDSPSGRRLADGTVDRAFVCPVRDNLVFAIPALAGFPKGAPVSYEPDCTWRAGEIRGQLDNALSAALATVLCRMGFTGRVVFTREEEIGRSWEYLMADLQEAESPGDLVVLDTSPFGEEELPGPGSVVLRRRDASGAFDSALVGRLAAAAERQGVPVLFKDEWLLEQAAREGRDPGSVRLGSTELGRLVAGSGGRHNGAPLQIPTRGYHTNREAASYASLAGALAVLADALGLQTPAV